jgi:hypothetical protein
VIDRPAELDLNRDESNVTDTLDDHLNDRAVVEQPENDADPVWTWNAPIFLTGDEYGSGESRSSRIQSISIGCRFEDDTGDSLVGTFGESRDGDDLIVVAMDVLRTEYVSPQNYAG